MKLKDIPDLASYLPDNTNLEADINEPAIECDIHQLPQVAGVNGPIPNLYKVTALSYAVRHGLSGVVELLLKHKADPNQADTFTLDGETHSYSLLFVTRYNPSILKLLIHYGANVETRNANGKNILEELLIERDHLRQADVWDSIPLALGRLFASITTDHRFYSIFNEFNNKFFKPNESLVNHLMNLENFFQATKIPCSIVADYCRPDLKLLSEKLAAKPKYIVEQFKAQCRYAAEKVAKKNRLAKLTEVVAGLSNSDIEEVVKKFRVEKQRQAVSKP